MFAVRLNNQCQSIVAMCDVWEAINQSICHHCFDASASGCFFRLVVANQRHEFSEQRHATRSCRHEGGATWRSAHLRRVRRFGTRHRFCGSPRVEVGKGGGLSRSRRWSAVLRTLISFVKKYRFFCVIFVDFSARSRSRSRKLSTTDVIRRIRLSSDVTWCREWRHASHSGGNHEKYVSF